MDIYIGNYENRFLLDMDESFNVPLTYSFFDLAEPLNQKSDFSKTIKIPATRRNAIALGFNARTSGVGKYLGESVFPAMIYSQGQRIMDGSMRISNISYSNNGAVSADAFIFGSRFSIIQALGESKVADVDMEWDDYSHEVDFPNFEDTTNSNLCYYKGSQVNIPYTDASKPFTIMGYRYPMVDFGNNTNRDWLLSDIQPTAYVREVVERIIWSTRNSKGDRYKLTTPNFFSENPEFDEVLFYDPSSPRKNSIGEEYYSTNGSSINATSALLDSDSTFANTLEQFFFQGTNNPTDFNVTTSVFTAPKKVGYSSSFFLDAIMQHVEPTGNFFGNVDYTLSFKMRLQIYNVTTGAIHISDVVQVSENNVGFFPGTLPNQSIETGVQETFTFDQMFLEIGDQITLSYSVEDFFMLGTYVTGGDVRHINLASITTSTFLANPFPVAGGRESIWTINQAGGIEKYIGNHTKKEALISVMNHFNLILESNDYTGEVSLVAYDDKVDYTIDNAIEIDEFVDSSSFGIAPAGLRSQMGTLNLGYKDGSGYFADLYAERNLENYGSRYIYDSDLWNKDVSRVQTIFQPAPVIEFKYDGSTGQPHNYLVCSFGKDDSPNEASSTEPKASDTKSGSPTLLYYKTLVMQNNGDVPANYNLTMDDGTTVNDMINLAGSAYWAYGGHFRIPGFALGVAQIYDDLNLDTTTEVYVGNFLQATTNSNVFNKFHVNRMYTLFSKDTIVATVMINANPVLVSKLTGSFGRVFSFYGRAWWLFELKDYVPGESTMVQAVFVAWHDGKSVTMESDIPFAGEGGENFSDGFNKLLGISGVGDKIPFKNS